MKKKNNLLITVILMTSLLVPACPAWAETADINYNESIFKIEQATAVRTKTYPEHMYNAASLPDNKIITLNNMDFIMNGNYSESDENDVIKIGANQEIEFSLDDEGIYVKNIAFIGAGYENDITADIKLYYSNETSQTMENIQIGAMTSQGEISYPMGKELNVGAQGRLFLFKEGAEDVYLNYAQIEPSQQKIISFSVIPDSDMFIAAVAYTEYTEDELQGEIDEKLALFDQFKDLTFKDINENNIEDAEKLLDGLIQGNRLGYEIATEENIELVSNLIDGYNYYSQISQLSENIQNIAVKYIENNEFIYTPEEISDADTTISELDQLVEYLQEYSAKGENIDKLKEIYLYFGLEYDLAQINYDIDEINIYIENIQSNVNNNDDTVPEQRNISLNYDTDLFFENGGTGSNVWEPLSTSFYESANLNVNIIDWLTDGVMKMDIKPAVMTENGTYEEGPSQGSVTFDYTEERLHSDSIYDNDGRGKDSVKVLPGGNPVTVDMSGKAASAFYVLIAGADKRTSLSIDENYVGGTTENINFVPLDRDSDWAARYNCEYYAGRKFGWPPRLYNNAISNVGFEITMYKIPLNAAKQIRSLTFNGSSGAYFVLAINEVPLSNVEIKENILKTYSEVVIDGKIDTSDPAKISQLVGYYNEMLEREMNLSSIDKNLIAEMEQMILTITPSIYRKDKNTIGADFDFNVPVDPSTLNVSVMINDIEVSNVETALLQDDTRLEIDIPADKDTSGTITVIIDKALALKKYPNITIIYDYTVSADINKFITSYFNEETSMLSLTNNSAVSQECIINSGIYGSDRKTIHFAQTEKLTVEPGKSAEKLITLYEAYKSMVQNNDIIFYLSVTDENLKSLCEISELRSADETVTGADYTQPVLQLDTNTLKINGFLAENEIVTINVSDQENNLIYSDNMLTNSEGYFGFEILLQDQNINKSGYLKIEIGAESLEEKYINNNVYFSTQQDRYDVINKLAESKSAEEVAAVFDELSQKLALNFIPYTELLKNETNKKALASRILINLTKFEKINESDTQDIKLQKVAASQLLIKQLSVLEAIKQGLREAVIGSNGLLAYDDVVGYSSIDSNGVTLYNIYNNSISSEGLNNIHKNIISEDFTSIEELLKILKENVIVYAIKNSKTNGTGHIASVLTEENADSVDMNISKYLDTDDKTDINKTILNSSFTDIDGLENVIKNYKQPSGTGSGSGSSSTGTGSGGNSSVSGGSKPLVMTDASSLVDNSNANNNNVQNDIFNDITSSHWAYNEVMNLYNKGIISGKGENKFCPDDSLTRAELVKMICLAQNVQAEYTDLGFEDVKEDDWFAPYVAAAYSKGWINGKDEKTFAPNEKVTRQDICTIIYRAGGIEQIEKSDLSDFDEVMDYAKEAVASLNYAGIISGFEDNTFRPFDFCTRAQAAVIIYRYTK